MKSYIRPHIDDLYGVIPAPGTEWQMRDTPMTQDTHQCHIQYLRGEGLEKVRSDRWGVVWRTTPQLATALEEVSEKVGYDPDEAVIRHGQTHLTQFARMSG